MRRVCVDGTINDRKLRSDGITQIGACHSLLDRSYAISDENGPYYWHVKSGNIQREPPEAPLHTKTEARRSLIKDNDSVSRISAKL